jgi:hypothetical protein
MSVESQEPSLAGAAASSLGPKDWWPIGLVILLYGLFLAAVLLCWWPFTGMTWQDRGEFGDSFNVVSALFNGLAFAGLIITIFIQARELRLQRVQLTLQRKELEAQRGEAKRLADAQEEQTILNSISAFIAAETYSNRNSSGGPSPTMVQAYKFLEGHLQRDMERLQTRITAGTTALSLHGQAPTMSHATRT